MKNGIDRDRQSPRIFWENMLPYRPQVHIVLGPEIATSLTARIYDATVEPERTVFPFIRSHPVIVKAYTIPTQGLSRSPTVPIDQYIQERLDQMQREFLFTEAMNRKGMKPQAVAFIIPPREILARDGNVYLVLEKFRGETLSEVIKKGKRFNTQEAVSITNDVLATLHIAHEEALAKVGKFYQPAILHRDIGTKNIFVDKRAHLFDWSIGIRTDEVPLLTFGNTNTAGDRFYMAPEQMALPEAGNPEGYPVQDRPTDLYQVGLLLWELLTNRSHAALLQSATGSNEIRGFYPYITTDAHSQDLQLAMMETGIDRGLQQIVLTAIQANPLDRFQYAKKMQESLRPFGRNRGRRSPSG